jgi:YHS domain-containing protein
MNTLALARLLAIALALPVQAQETKAPASDPAADAKIIAQQLPSYPLSTCPVSKEGLDAMGKPMDIVHEGRLVRLCCKSCVKEFKKDPSATLKAIDSAVVEAQGPTYPLKTCPVSGEELGSPEMGAPLDVVHGTRLVRLCCKGCVKGFQKDPAATLAKIDAALIAEQKKTYPLKTCLVSDEPIEGEGFDQLYGTRLTRFCCEKCAAGFAKEPTKYLAKLDKPSAK